MKAAALPSRLDLGDGHIFRCVVAYSAPEDIIGGTDEHWRANAEVDRTIDVDSDLAFANRCIGFVAFDVPENTDHERPCWQVESWDPLTLSPSLLCVTCGDHGFIRAGRWVRA